MKTKTVSTQIPEKRQDSINCSSMQHSSRACHDYLSGCAILLMKMGRTIPDTCAHSGGDEDSDMNLIKPNGSGKTDWFMNYISPDYLMPGDLFADNVLAKGARYVEKD